MITRCRSLCEGDRLSGRNGRLYESCYLEPVPEVRNWRGDWPRAARTASSKLHQPGSPLNTPNTPNHRTGNNTMVEVCIDSDGAYRIATRRAPGVTFLSPRLSLS